MHGPQPLWHYGRWLMQSAPAAMPGFYQVVRPGPDGKLVVNGQGGGDTGACQVKHNPVDRALYHTDWLADRATAFLDGIEGEQPWFLWASFPDPHHPWDPPQAELQRHPWRETELPAFLSGQRGGRAGAAGVEAASLGRLVRRPAGVELRGAAGFRAGRDDAGPVPRDQCRDSCEERVDRRGLRPDLGCDRRLMAGTATPISSSRPIMASSRASSACCSRGRTMSMR